MAAQFALGPELLFSNAAWQSVERSQLATRNLRFAIRMFSPCAKERRTASLSSLLLASLLILPGTASATGFAPGSVAIQASPGASTANQADNDVRELNLGKPIERELAGGEHHAYQVSLKSGRFLHAFVEPHCVPMTVKLSGPDNAKLTLSLVDQQGRPQDGFLQLQDIYNLNLPADLVVLSACETGLGKEIRGEGLMGLTRGFMYAGASRVIASLWKVDDVATAELMERLYHDMLTNGLQPAAALRQSQIEMWEQKRWQSPYYWAAFVIQGEWK